MLTKKQKQRLTVMTQRYVIAMGKHHNICGDKLWEWGRNYKAAMSRQLQKQGKR